MATFQIIAWVIITIFSLVLAPFLTLSIIFYGAKMPILATIASILAIFNFIRRIYIIIKKI